jgi:hypothetical protein
LNSPVRTREPFDNGLVVASEKSVVLAEARNAHRPEIPLEEDACRRSVARRLLDGAAAGRLQGGMERLPGMTGRRAAHDNLATVEKGGKGGGMVVRDPTVELRPIHGLKLHVGDAERLGQKLLAELELIAVGRRRCGLNELR